MMKSNELRDKMSAIADLALSCDAKVGTFESRPYTETRVDDGEKCAIVHHYAAKIALAALELCRPEELETVALALEKLMPVFPGDFMMSAFIASRIAKHRIPGKYIKGRSAADLIKFVLIDKGEI